MGWGGMVGRYKGLGGWGGCAEVTGCEDMYCLDMTNGRLDKMAKMS